MTVLAITHQPAWVEIADRVYRIDQGNVLEDSAAAFVNQPVQSAQDEPDASASGAIVTFPSRIS